MHLVELQKENSDHIFIVRGIARMGFRSQELLEQYFAKFGAVSRVMVAHSKVKPQQASSVQRPRLRPGSLGFVVMGCAKSVECIFHAGPEQTIAGIPIRVERYQRITFQGTGAQGDDESQSSSWPGDWRAARRPQFVDHSSEDSSERGGGTAGGARPQEELRQSHGAFAAAPSAAHPRGAAEFEDAEGPAHVHDPPQLNRLASTLTRLLSIVDQWSDHEVNSKECVEALASAQEVRRQLSSFVDQCKNLLGNSSSSNNGGAHDFAAVAPMPSAPPPMGLAPPPHPLWAMAEEVGGQPHGPSVVAFAEMLHRDVSRLLQMLRTGPSDFMQAVPSVGTAATAVGLAEAAAIQLRLMREGWQRHGHHAMRASGLLWNPRLAGVSPGTLWDFPHQRWHPSIVPPNAVFNSDSLPLNTSVPAFATATATSPAASATGASSSTFAEIFCVMPHGEADVVMPQGDDRGTPPGLQPLPDRLANKKQTLGMHLTELQGEDPKCVFIVRRIGVLGFKSQECLANHYSQYGKVSRVLVAHSKVKPFRSGVGQPRIRPGSLGFIVMVSPKSVKCILAEGKEQSVAGCRITVEPFEQTAKPRDDGGCVSVSGDTTSTSTGTGTTQGSDPQSNSSGSGGSAGSDKGSDKSNPSQASNSGSGGSNGSDKGSENSSESKPRAHQRGAKAAADAALQASQPADQTSDVSGSGSEEAQSPAAVARP